MDPQADPQEQQQEEVKEERPPKQTEAIKESLGAVQKEMDGIDTTVKDKLSCLEMQELKYMKGNMDYTFDFCSQLPAVLKMMSLYEQTQDNAQRLASENVEQLSELEEQRKVNDDLWKQFAAKQQELKKLADAYQAKKAQFSKESLVKIMQQKTSELNKES